MSTGLIGFARKIAYQTPILQGILKNRRDLALKLQQANDKIVNLEKNIDQLDSILNILQKNISNLNDISNNTINNSELIDKLSNLVLKNSSDLFEFKNEILSKFDLLEENYKNFVVGNSDDQHIFIDEVELSEYDTKLAQELAIFSEDDNVHNLPDIFHYWSNAYLRPMLEELDCSGVNQFYAKYLFESTRTTQAPYRFVSIGAGNGDVEIDIAKLLLDMGLTDFTIECLEYNPSMLERGRSEAHAQNVGPFLEFTQADFNQWKPIHTYSAIMANHSLHHVVNLEGLFDTIREALDPSGYFVTGDMVGRNGHQRWPEARLLVDQFWAELPDRYHYNQQLKREEPIYIDHDCSSEGFEGIRAQDIMPLLLEKFHFKVFVGFLNAISPFIDRSFGHNFDPNKPSDRAFIDKVHAADEEGFKSGTIKPTQIFAVLSVNTVIEPFYSRGLSPDFSVRAP